MVDKSIQVSPAMDSQSTQCSIRIDEPSLYCQCYIRQRGDMATTDHSYIRKKKKIKDWKGTIHPSTNILKLKKRKLLIALGDNEEYSCKSDENTDNPCFHCPIIRWTGKIKILTQMRKILQIYLHCFSQLSVFVDWLDTMSWMFCLNICHEDTRRYINGTCVTVYYLSQKVHLSWKIQPFEKEPVGNILIATATFLSGYAFSRLSTFIENLECSVYK